MHRRRRTALTVSAALLVAAPLLAACSNEAHPGAAAVVGQERITMAQLQARVGEVRAAQEEAMAEAGGDYAKAVENTGGLTRNTLQSMVFGRVLHETAADAGITVSRKEVQDLRAEWVARSRGSEERLEAGMLQQFSVPPARIDDFLRTQLEAEKLYASLGADPQTEAGQQAYVEAITATSDRLGVDINPRYGTWKTSDAPDSTTPWVRQVSEAPEQA